MRPTLDRIGRRAQGVGMMRRLGLRARMAASYVLVTAAAVLAVEGVLLGLLVPRALSGSDLARRTQYQATTDAKTLSLVATKLSSARPDLDNGQVLQMLAMSGVQDTPIGAQMTPDARGVKIPFAPASKSSALEALVDLNGVVLATSAPLTLPPGSRVPADWQLPKGGGVATSTGRHGVAWAASPVATAASPELMANAPDLTLKMQSGKKPPPAAKGPDPSASPLIPGTLKGLRQIAVLYVQVPATEGDVGKFAALQPMLVASAGVLGLIVPVGVVFGLLSTGRLIRRLRRLADATAAVAEGDFRPRVPVDGADEIGRLEDSLNRMAERLGAALDVERRLAGTDARRAERARIARELHDSISQDLFSMSLLAGGLRKALPPGSALRPEAEAMERAAARTMREMQALLLELRPVALEDAGLQPALEELCRAYETRLGVLVPADLDDVALDPPAEHAVLRVVQEALGNAIKHGAPDVVRVRLTADGDTVVVEVRDDGDGFDPDRVADRHGMGLALMRERIEELGGRFDLVSRPGAGTTVRAWLPAAQDAAHAAVPDRPEAGVAGRLS
jgi:signal transduction histidine kinase